MLAHGNRSISGWTIWKKLGPKLGSLCWGNTETFDLVRLVNMVTYADHPTIVPDGHVIVWADASADGVPRSSGHDDCFGCLFADRRASRQQKHGRERDAKDESIHSRILARAKVRFPPIAEISSVRIGRPESR